MELMIRHRVLSSILCVDIDQWALVELNRGKEKRSYTCNHKRTHARTHTHTLSLTHACTHILVMATFAYFCVHLLHWPLIYQLTMHS